MRNKQIRNWRNQEIGTEKDREIDTKNKKTTRGRNLRNQEKGTRETKNDSFFKFVSWRGLVCHWVFNALSTVNVMSRLKKKKKNTIVNRGGDKCPVYCECPIKTTRIKSQAKFNSLFMTHYVWRGFEACEVNEPARWNCVCRFPGGRQCKQKYCDLSSVPSLDRLFFGGKGEAWLTIQPRSSSSLFCRKPLWAFLGWAGMSTLMFSFQHFLCRPRYRPPSKVPWRMVLERLSWRVTYLKTKRENLWWLDSQHRIYLFSNMRYPAKGFWWGWLTPGGPL